MSSPPLSGSLSCSTNRPALHLKIGAPVSLSPPFIWAGVFSTSFESCGTIRYRAPEMTYDRTARAPEVGKRWCSVRIMAMYLFVAIRSLEGRQSDDATAIDSALGRRRRPREGRV